MTLFRRIGVGLVAGIVAATGAVSGVVSQAQAAGYCNIYPPTRIATWGTVQEFDVEFGSGCVRSGVTRASWTGEYRAARKGYLLSAVSPPSGSAHYTAREWHPYGTIEWIPGGATDVHGRPATQNAPVTTVRLGAVAYLSVTRSGGYHEITARAYHYSPSAGTIVPSGGRTGQVQFRTPRSPIWRPAVGVRLAPDGRAVVRTWSPGPRYYRVSFGEVPTVWSASSAQIRAR